MVGLACLCALGDDKDVKEAALEVEQRRRRAGRRDGHMAKAAAHLMEGHAGSVEGHGR